MIHYGQKDVGRTKYRHVWVKALSDLLDLVLEYLYSDHIDVHTFQERILPIDGSYDGNQAKQ